MNQLISGQLNHSRKQANFLSYYLRDKPEERLRYLKQTITSRHIDLLYPFIRITKRDRYLREMRYIVEVPQTNPTSGTLYHSRSQSDYLLRLNKDKRQEEFQHSIAQMHRALLIPFITIIGHSDDFRTVDYTINAEFPKEGEHV